MTPSTGIVSPASTRTISPTRTFFASTTVSTPSLMTRAVCGVSLTSLSMPARALATVRSSRSAPSCMMKATSPAAKSSPIATEAISARDTKTSALISKRVMSPIVASTTIGTPHKMIATHDKSTSKSLKPKKLATRAAQDMTRNAMSFLRPPHSNSASSFSTSASMMYTRHGV